MGRVLVTRTLPEGGLEPLAGHEIVQRADDVPYTPAELRDAAAGVDGIVSLLTDQVDAGVLAAAPLLRVVANVAVGYDNIDVEAARRAGVVVCNTPGVLDEATADLTWALVLAASRRLTEAEADLRAGRWSGWGVTQYLGRDLQGATLGLVGYGGIGQAVARRAAGFGMSVAHHTRTPTGEPGWVASLDELLSSADVLSLHVPLSAETRHLIGARELALMKPDAVLVNTARGLVVDEEALAAALSEGRLFGAGLDVYEHEPAIHAALLAAPNVTLLPHVGSATVGTRTRMARMAAQAVADVLAGRQPQNVVAPQ